MVLNNCMEALDYDEHDQRFSMRFSYELINDIYTDWSDIQNNATDVNSDVAPQANVIDCNQLTPKVTKMLQQKETHPVYLMVCFIVRCLTIVFTNQKTISVHSFIHVSSARVFDIRRTRETKPYYWLMQARLIIN